MASATRDLPSELIALIARTDRLLDIVVTGKSPAAQLTSGLNSFLASLSQSLRYLHIAVATGTASHITLQGSISETLSAISPLLDALYNVIAPAVKMVHLTSQSGQLPEGFLPNAFQPDFSHIKGEYLETNDVGIRNEGDPLPSSNETTQGHTGGESATAKSKVIEETRRSLQLELNNLFLKSYFISRVLSGSLASDPGEVHRQVRRTQSRLEQFCTNIFESKDKIVPNMDDELKRQNQDNQSAVTFTLREANPLENNTELSRVVCPNAKLPGLLKIKRGFKLEFQCLCFDSEHSSQIHYLPSVGGTVLWKTVSENGKEQWEMLLQNSLARSVMVTISDVTGDLHGDLEILSQTFGAAYAKWCVKNFDNGSVSGEYTRAGESYLAAKIATGSIPVPWLHFSLKPLRQVLRGMDMKLGNHSLSLSKPAPELGDFIQYASAATELLKSWKNTTGAPKYPLAPTQFFLVLMFRKTPKGFETYAIQVSLDTRLTPGPLKITINTPTSVVYKRDATNGQILKCSEIIFYFSTSEALTTFAKGIKCMQDEVRAQFLQRPLWQDEILYRQFSDSLSAQIVTVYSPQTKNYRIILSGNDGMISVCWEVGSAFLDNVSHGLYKFVNQAPAWIVDRLDSSKMKPAKISWIELLSRERQKLPLPRVAGGVMTKSASDTSSDTWMTQLESLVLVLRARKPLKFKEIDQNHQPVKIAILDTGIRRDHHQIDKIKYKNFTDKTDDKDDLTGHGTDSVDLLLKVYESAQLCVGRIFKGNTSDEESGPKAMANGIEWAVEMKVDIISISAGFRPDKGCAAELRNAVDAASKAGILIFAAASNWGNTAEVAFPAAIADKVMCIFATDGANRHAREFNPDPRPYARNFAILGVDVEVNPNKARIRGTSVATPLAAGLAALLIDFSRQLDCRSAIDFVEVLPTKAGITAIFMRMSRGGAERYDCLVPWKILGLADENQSLTEIRAQMRANVRGELSSALRYAQ